MLDLAVSTHCLNQWRLIIELDPDGQYHKEIKMCIQATEIMKAFIFCKMADTWLRPQRTKTWNQVRCCLDKILTLWSFYGPVNSGPVITTSSAVVRYWNFLGCRSPGVSFMRYKSLPCTDTAGLIRTRSWIYSSWIVALFCLLVNTFITLSVTTACHPAERHTCICRPIARRGSWYCKWDGFKKILIGSCLIPSASLNSLRPSDAYMRR